MYVSRHPESTDFILLRACHLSTFKPMVSGRMIQRRYVIAYKRFGRTYCSHVQER